MQFVPEPKANTFSESLKRRVRSWLERQGNGPEEIFAHEGAVVRRLFEASEQMRARTVYGWNVEALTPFPVPTNLRTRVDVMEDAGFFMNPWAGLLGEKHGKLVRVGQWQHLPHEHETTWTKMRKQRPAQSK